MGDMDILALLKLLQLCNSSLPVGAYSYSEGVEALCQAETLTHATHLIHWLSQELNHGSIRVEAAVMVRCHRAFLRQEYQLLTDWNNWFTASRESEELQLQSLQMGRSLLKLFLNLSPEVTSLPDELVQGPCNFPIAFGIAASHWHIHEHQTVLGYLQSWSANLIGAGVKLIPLGQTQGQQILSELEEAIAHTSQAILQLQDDELESCSWGLQLASMAHETLYSRLFRS